MFRRTVLRVVNAAGGRPVTSMVVMSLLGATVAATAIAASEQTGGPITAVKVVREESGTSFTSSSYTDVPGATTTITVPSGQRALILARFTSNSICNASSSSSCTGWVRILIGGVEGAPTTTRIFDYAPPGDTTLGYHSLERSRGGFNGLPAGTYEVKVQAYVSLSGTSMNLGDWQLTVERSQIG